MTTIEQYKFTFKNGSKTFEGFLEHTNCEVENCPNKTFNPPNCLDHWEEFFGLKIGKSEIPEAGMGLFATDTFIKNEVICEYVGEHLNKKDLDNRYGKATAPYAIKLDKNKYIDGALKRGIANFANWKKPANARLETVEGETSKIPQSIRLVASKRISAGSEIFVNYGKSYRLQESGVSWSTKKIETIVKPKPKKKKKVEKVEKVEIDGNTSSPLFSSDED
jgi:SET domain-containing protein